MNVDWFRIKECEEFRESQLAGSGHWEPVHSLFEAPLLPKKCRGGGRKY